MPDSGLNKLPSVHGDPAHGVSDVNICNVGNVEDATSKVNLPLVGPHPSEVVGNLPNQLVGSDARLFSALEALSKGARRGPNYGLWFGFLLTVVIPTSLVIGYLYLFAADQYSAEFRFSVTETNPSLPGSSATTNGNASSPVAAAAAAAMASLGSNMTSSIGSPNAAAQNYVVVDYLKSQQAVDELDTRIHIRRLYSGQESRPDWWARFDEKLPLDRFLPYWNRMISAQYDPITGVGTIRVRAFTPQEALLIANTLVSLAEQLINEIAMRPMRDAIRYAEAEVKRSELRLKDARDALAEYRKTTSVVDPAGSIANNVALIQSLRGQLAQLVVEFRATSAQQRNPDAANLKLLSSRINATKSELARVEEEVSQSNGANQSIAELTGRYEELDLQRQYAAAMVISSMQALDQARANAAAQHFYLTPYVRPSLPSTASYPKRIETVLVAALAFTALWMITLMAVKSVREHL